MRFTKFKLCYLILWLGNVLFENSTRRDYCYKRTWWISAQLSSWRENLTPKQTNINWEQKWKNFCSYTTFLSFVKCVFHLVKVLSVEDWKMRQIVCCQKNWKTKKGKRVKKSCFKMRKRSFGTGWPFLETFL